MRKLHVVWVIVVCALATLVAGALAARTSDPGVTATSITIGGTIPLSGPASAYASVGRGAGAYFSYVNSKGGVNGRKIVYKYVDDQYNAALTVTATKQLVEQDKVFAIYNSLGTEHNLAIRDYLNQLNVPQLFTATGATTFGRDYKQYPWTIGYQPSYVGESKIYGQYIAKTTPSAKIAILYQDDDYGKDLIRGLQVGLRGKASIVAQQGYDVRTASDVQSQMAELKASGADTFMVFATPKFAIQSLVFARKLGWKPHVFMNTVSSASNIMFIASEGGTNPVAEGAISVTFLKDPDDKQWASDAAIKLYRTIMKRYAPGQNVKDVYNVYGMASAYTLLDALKKAGKNLTRDGLMKAARSLNETDNPFVLPGVVVKTSATDGFPIQQGRLQRYSKGHWTLFGPLAGTG